MINGVKITEKKQIHDERGKVMHMIKSSDPEFINFGEIYFSCINPGVIKEDTSTKAIVIVIDLMKVKYPIKSFDKMISMSHLIAEKIEAVICDEKMQPLSVQLIQHLQTKAQEIEYSNNLSVKAI